MKVYITQKNRYCFFGTLLVLSLLALLAFSVPVLAAEIAPITSQDLPLNGKVLDQKIEGHAGQADPEHWYRLYKTTIEEAGFLTLTLEATSSSARTDLGWFYLYDVDGVEVLERRSIEKDQATTLTAGLYPGAYYLKIDKASSIYDLTFSLSSTFAAPALVHYQEPNDLPEQALDFPLNATAKAHLGYRHDGYRDSLDWWKITTTDDGLLTVTFEGVASATGELRLLDVDAGWGLDSASFGYSGMGTTVRVEEHLRPGTYYVTVSSFERPFNYVLTNTFTAALYENDHEPNDTFALAQSLALNKSATGHLGYCHNSHWDSRDWWKITTNQDGLLKVQVEGQEHAIGKVTLYGYFNDRFALADSTYLGMEDHLSTTGSVELGLKAGTYYALVEYNTVTSPWSYQISNNLTPMQVDNVVEEHPKDQAKNLSLNNSATGSMPKDHHVDWWEITTTENGLLSVKLNAANDFTCDISLCEVYGRGETYTITSGFFASDRSDSICAELQPGTYYVRVGRSKSDEDASYTISNRLTVPAKPADPEPNDTFLIATTLHLDEAATGHLGYRQNGTADKEDWWKITTTENGILKIDFQAEPAADYEVCLYYSNGRDEPTMKRVNDEEKHTLSANLKPGAYYVLVRAPYAKNAFTYTLQASLQRPVFAADQEPNDNPQTAQVLQMIGNYGSATGQLGYRESKYQQDDVDWWKFTVETAGELKLNFEANLEGDLNYYRSLSLSLYEGNINKKIVTEKTQLDNNTAELTVDVKPGAYYFELYNYGTNCAFSYSFSISIADDYLVWESKEAFPKKAWTVKFNAPLDPDTLEGAVSVVNPSGKIIDIIHTYSYLTEDQRSIRINPPDAGYSLGSHTLLISDKLRSATGDTLKKPVLMQFMVK